MFAKRRALWEVERTISGSESMIAGYNGDQQTDSLETYRQWLQEKGGVSIYV